MGTKIDYTQFDINVTQVTHASLLPDESFIVTHSSDPNYKRVVEILLPLQTNYNEMYNPGTETNYDFDADKVEFTGSQVSLLPELGATGMLAYYIFNDDVKDSVDSHDGSNTGGTFDTGIVDKCLVLDGASYVDIPNSPDFVSNSTDLFAFEFWIDAYPPDGELINLWNETENRRSWRFYIESNMLHFDTSSDGINVDGIYPDGRTLGVYYGSIHIGLIVMADNTVNIYIDGNLSGHSGINAPIFNNTVDAVRIGALGGATPSNFYIGSIAELAFYKNVDLNQGVGMYNNYFSSHMYLNTTGRHLSHYDTDMQNIKTKTSGQIDTSTWLGIDHMGINGDAWGSYEVSLLFSVDGRTTWNKWAETSPGEGDWAWHIVTEATQGTLFTDLPGSSTDWGLLFVAGTLDIILQLKTDDASTSPTVYSVVIASVLPGRMPAELYTITYNMISATETRIINNTNSGGTPQTLTNIQANILI